MSNEGENVVTAMMGVALLGLLLAGFAAFGAPVVALLAPVPLILLCVAAVRKDLLHVRRHGWNTVGPNDGPNGEDGRPGPPGPDEPVPQGPSGDGETFDWDAFVTQFWDHVDRQPVA